jgi:hypothetical protein
MAFFSLLDFCFRAIIIYPYYRLFCCGVGFDCAYYIETILVVLKIKQNM